MGESYGVRKFCARLAGMAATPLCTGDRTGDLERLSRSGLLDVAVWASDQIFGFSVCLGSALSHGEDLEVGLQVALMVDGKGVGLGLLLRQTGLHCSLDRSAWWRSSSSSSSTITLMESLSGSVVRNPMGTRDSIRGTL